MRDILFRGKRTDNGEWAEGYYYKAKYCRTDDELCDYITVPHPKEYNEPSSHYIVDPDTVGQYTGLKDKNGKKTFEGDILHIAKIADGLGGYYHPPLDCPVNVVVKWDLCAWMWETLCDDKMYITFPNAWCHYECEIIGNIHDNHELIGGEANG